MKSLVRSIAEPGLEIIRGCESLRLQAYYATAEEKIKGIVTIGYGHTHGVKIGDTCTIQQANQWLKEDCADAEKAINWRVTAPLNQNQFDALVSLVFNIGETNFAASTLLKLLNAKLYPDAAEQFPRWNKQAGKVLGGLVARRAKERALFLRPEG